MLFGTSQRILDVKEQIYFANRLLPSIKFAWFPIKLNNDNYTNGKWLWLEKYIEVGVNTSVWVNYKESSTDIKRIRLISSREELFNALGGYRPTSDSRIDYPIRHSRILHKQETFKKSLVDLNVQLVMKNWFWFYVCLKKYIREKEAELQQLKEEDNNDNSK